MSTDSDQRVTMRTITQMARQHKPLAMLTCYDATTAGLLWQGGVRAMLVGDTAAQVILGHDSTLPAPMDFMVEITAAVRRGAPNAFVMADMPFGSYQCGDDAAVANAIRFLTDGRADVVKLEVDGSFAPLVARLSSAGVPVVAHIGSRPQQVRKHGGYSSVGRTRAEAARIVETGKLMLENGASMILIEAVPNEVSKQIVELAEKRDKANGGNEAGPTSITPIIGCGAGPACHGHVVVLHDLLGITDWQPPFARPIAQMGPAIKDAATNWVQLIESGKYLADDHPYRMEDD